LKVDNYLNRQTNLSKRKLLVHGITKVYIETINVKTIIVINTLTHTLGIHSEFYTHTKTVDRSSKLEQALQLQHINTITDTDITSTTQFVIHSFFIAIAISVAK